MRLFLPFCFVLVLLVACGPLIEGQEGVLRTASGGQALVSVDQAAFQEAQGATTEKLAQMRDAGRIFLVPSGTPIRVIVADAAGYTVELLDGSGRRGIVPAAFVQR